MKNKLISIITPCFNEEENVEELVLRIKKIMESQPYLYEHIFIDNASTDLTVKKITQMILEDKHLKLITLVKNFGHLKSPYYALTKSVGDAVILIASDLQDPPELIPELLKKWEMGFKNVLIVKEQSMENKIIFFIRKLYYRILSCISENPVIINAHGSGLYDRLVVQQLINLKDPYPYLRGLVAELGYPVGLVKFNQPKRLRGKTKNNIYSLLDTAILGITKSSRFPLRIITLAGFCFSLINAIFLLVFLALKVVYWDQINLGIAPILIGLFFIASIQVFFLGILGEYISLTLMQVRNLPLVIESSRVNFDY
jgi:glycosyltransferase involved in cell wall biosynthesis